MLGSNVISMEKLSGDSTRGGRILTAEEVFTAEFLLLLQKINLNF